MNNLKHIVQVIFNALNFKTIQRKVEVCESIHAESNFTQNNATHPSSLDNFESKSAVLSAFVNSISDILVFSLDSNYCYTVFNEMYRLEVKRVFDIDITVGSNFLDCLHLSDSKPKFKQSIDKAFLGDSFSEIHHHPLFDKYYEFSWNPIRYCENIVGITAFIKDISERKRADEILFESERKLKEAQEMAHIGFWNWNIETGQVEWSEEVFKIFCLDPDLFTPSIDSILAFSPWPEDRQRDKELIKFAIETHGEGHYQQRFIRQDKSIGYYYSNFQGKYNAYGSLSSIFGTILDISKYKHFEENLFKKDVLLNLTGSTAKVGGWEIDIETMSQIWTEEVYHIHELDTDFIPNVESAIEFYAPQSRPIIEEAVFRAIEYGEPFDLELEFITAKGNQRWVHSIGKSIQENGKTIKVFGSFQDITDRKQIEKELIVAKDKAEENDRLKTAFLHNISHEVRTPMNAIVGFSALLNDFELLPEKREAYTDAIIHSSNQLLTIITDIISISTLEAGQEKVQEKDSNINVICRLVHELFYLKAKDLKIPLQYKTMLADEEANVIIDETKVIQILTNLIGNSLKFTQQGFVNFGYTIKNDEIEFFVQDSGIGISSDMHEEIFKRFRQVEIGSARKFGGSGLGLSISKAYVELLGGKIWVQAELEQGSTFYFTIPCKMIPKLVINKALRCNP